MIDSGTALLSSLTVILPEMLVLNLLHQSTKGVLAGSSKVGKTWLLLDLALSVATGTPFLKWKTTAGRVLFINFEIHRSFMRDRIQLLKKHKQLENIDRLDVWTLRGQSVNCEALLPTILDRAKEKAYSLIILDPIYKAMVGKSENSSSGVSTLCHHIERLIEKTGAAVVYAHHYSKGNQSRKQALDRLSGSGVFTRDADTIMTLTEHGVKNCYSVETTLRNLPAQAPIVVEWVFPQMVERSDLDPAEIRTLAGEHPDPVDEYLLNLLKEKPLSTTEWEAAAKEMVSRSTFMRHKGNLEKEVRITQNLKGRTWRLTQIGGKDPETDASETHDTSDTGGTCDTPPDTKSTNREGDRNGTTAIDLPQP